MRDQSVRCCKTRACARKLMLSEAPERDEAYKNYPIVLDDPAARKYVAAAPYHGYDFKDYSDVAKLHERAVGCENRTSRT